MKILAVTSSNGSFHTLRPEAELFVGLHKAGVEVEVMADGSTPYAQVIKDAGIPLYDYRMTKKIHRPSIKKIRETLMSGGHDILHTLHNKTISNGNFAAMGLDVKVVTYRGITLKRTDPGYYLTHLHHRVDCVICLSKEIEANIRKNLIFKKTQTRQIYKGQDVRWFANIQPASIRQELNLSKDAFVVVLLANIRKVKGLDYLIDSMNHIPTNRDIHIVVAGRNSDIPNYLDMASNTANPDKIHLLGFREDALSIAKAADLFVLPTSGSEGLGRAVMESMSMGIPVVSTRCGGPEELIEHGKSGLLIERKNSKAIADAIIELMDNPTKRLELGACGKRRMETTFSIERAVSETKKLYEDLLEESH